MAVFSYGVDDAIVEVLVAARPKRCHEQYLCWLLGASSEKWRAGGSIFTLFRPLAGAEVHQEDQQHGEECCIHGAAWNTYVAAPVGPQRDAFGECCCGGSGVTSSFQIVVFCCQVLM